LLIAEKLDSKLPKIQRLLARTELVFAKLPAHFVKAHERLSGVISSIQSDADELLYCRTLRVEVAFRWAEHERTAGSVDEETLKRMRVAIDDLKQCDRILNNRPFDPAVNVEMVKRKHYHKLHNHLRAMVTLAEVEMDLNDPQTSRTDFQRCEEILQTLVEYTNANDLKDKVPATGDLKERISDGNNRLQGMGIANSRSLLGSRPRSSQAG